MQHDTGGAIVRAMSSTPDGRLEQVLMPADSTDCLNTSSPVILLTFPVDARYSVIVEDDGRTAYAYLMDNGAIIGDVWLYNRDPAPSIPPWTSGESPPFVNPRPYANDLPLRPLDTESDISVDATWEESTLKRVSLILRGERLAVLAPLARPGWCANAAKAGPLAKPLAELKEFGHGSTV